MKKFLLTAITLFVMACSIGLLNSCSDTSAKTYEQKYLEQKAITDSVVDRMNELSSSIDSLYFVSSNKIDTLKAINNQAAQKIFQLYADNNKLQDSLANFKNEYDARTDTMLYYINEAVLNYIDKIKSQ